MTLDQAIAALGDQLEGVLRLETVEAMCRAAGVIGDVTEGDLLEVLAGSFASDPHTADGDGGGGV